MSEIIVSSACIGRGERIDNNTHDPRVRCCCKTLRSRRANLGRETSAEGDVIQSEVIGVKRIADEGVHEAQRSSARLVSTRWRVT